jgi:8-oxo-dGTP pyrophosphatase MutT (NUDIX family)
VKKNNNDIPFKVSPSRTLITTPVMDVVTSKVCCQRNEVEKDFFKLVFSPWVNIVACTDKKEIILIRQYRYGSDRIELEIPGGGVNKGEPPLTAGTRELLEETGYAGDNARIIGNVCPNPAIQDNICYTVLVENVKKISDPKLDEMEDIEVLIVAEDEVFSLLQNGTINHGLVLNGLMFYAMTRRRSIW